MSVAFANDIPTARPDMAKRKPSKPEPGAQSGQPGQINFKVPAVMMARLNAISDALSIDLANLVRMVLSENLYIYEQRADQARKHGKAED